MTKLTDSNHRRIRWVGPLALVVATVAALFVAEGILRLTEGQPLTSLYLSIPVFRQKPPPAVLRPLAEQYTWDEEIDRAWIDELPPAYDAPAPKAKRLMDLDESERDRARLTLPLDRQWNSNWIRHWGCRKGSQIHSLPNPVFVFDAPRTHSRPPFRYPPSAKTAMGLVTNRYGWRGRDISLNKQPNTIRLAFVGASTTVGNHGHRFSYPEYVVHWLNAWAHKTGRDVRFDGINAGREGIGSSAISAIVDTEILPMEPDLVVYYEGSNQFDMSPLIDRKVEIRTVFDKTETPVWRQRLVSYENRSVLARKIRELGDRVRLRGGVEPEKPAYVLTWPSDVDEQSPDLRHPALPVKLTEILADLRTIENDVERAGGELALASFVWLVHDGLRLDPVRQAWFLHFYRTRYWPFRYADIRRLADFQNRTLAKFAEENGLLFVDLAKEFPMDKSLFVDGIHFSEDGVRLQAWIVMQGLLPRIRERIDSGAWPRADTHFLLGHPGIGEPFPVDSPCENLDSF